MSKKVKKIDNSFELMDKQIAELLIQKNLSLEEALKSNDPASIMKANLYINKVSKNSKKSDMKSWFFLPDDYAYSGAGYKSIINSVSFETLKKIGNTYVAKLIKNTRIDQVFNYLNFTTDEQEIGYTIRRRKSLLGEDEKELSNKDKNKIEYINNFIKDGGINRKWDNTDDFHEFVRMILNDSLTYDQLAFENIRNRKGELIKYKAVDASLIRFLDSNDPRYVDSFKGLEMNGYYPKYGMVWNGRILNHPISGNPIIYYPWELGFGIRNKSTDVKRSGYGVSELETAVEIITWILWGFQYNGNFFKQGSQPKGFINIKDGGLDNSTLNEFRQGWRQMMTGVQNSHKIPVFEGIDLEWNDLQKNNRDMEFNSWMEFLLVILCSLFRIDPTELGFHFKGQAEMFGQQGQKERIEHSKEKGLKPLLIFLQKVINKNIVSEIDEEFEFVFTGIDIKNEEERVKIIDSKLKAGIVSFESEFEKEMGRPYDEKKDTILNQVFQQAQQAKQYGGQDMNEEVDNQVDEEDQESENPFTKGVEYYINNNLNK